MRHGSWNPSAPETKSGAPTRRPPVHLGAEFNNFLFAAAAETDGGTVSVLSALARLDLDPWGEAAKLARLPKELAAHRLAGLIAPGAAAAPAQARRTAARLVALLPSGFTLPAPQTATAAAGPAAGGPAGGGPAIAHARSILSFLLIFVVAMLGIQCVARISSPQPHSPTHITAPPAPTPSPARPGHMGR
jgi:hypothetical protein